MLLGVTRDHLKALHVVKSPTALVLILPVEFHCRYVVRICSLRCCWLFNKQLSVVNVFFRYFFHD